jgi:hypothetical protein
MLNIIISLHYYFIFIFVKREYKYLIKRLFYSVFKFYTVRSAGIVIIGKIKIILIIWGNP